MVQSFRNKLTSVYNNEALRFIVVFFILFCIFNYGNKFFFSVVSPDTQYYNKFFSQHFNYIQGFRSALIIVSASILKLMGYTIMHTDHQILALNGIPCNINYSCLGLGVMSFWAAFVIAFPKPAKQKMLFMAYGLITIFLLNIVRIVSLTSLTVEIPNNIRYFSYQHDTFNYTIYLILFTMIYFWIKNQEKAASSNKIAV